MADKPTPTAAPATTAVPGTRTASDPRAPGRKVPLYQSDPEGEDDVDLAGEDSFPASDPPSHTPISHPGKPCPDKG